MTSKKNYATRGMFFIFAFSLLSLSFAFNASAEENATSEKTFSFINIKPGSTIKGALDIKVNVPYSDAIEIILTKANSNTPILTSQAKKLDGDNWSISFSSKNIPDGVYYLSAKIKNPFGEFETSKVKINIDNSNSKNSKAITQKDIDDWEKEVNLTSSDSIQKDVDEFLDSMLSSEWLGKYFNVASCKSKSQCGSQADPDQDELVNFEEFRLGTNPVVSDTDTDGYSDGDEVKNGFDPLKYSPGHTDDKMQFESPKENGQVQADIYKILDVISTEISSDKTGITMRGKGLPSSFVNIYIFSSPIILTVKTDKSGSWSYTLDKNIDDGQHQVYVAVTDNTGKITAKSEPLFFVKKASAVNIVPISSASEVSSPAENRQASYLIVGMIMAGIALLISLTFIGFKIATNKKDPGQLQ